MNAYGVRDILAHVFRAQRWEFDDYLFGPIISGGAQIADGNLTIKSGGVSTPHGSVGPASDFAQPGFCLLTNTNQTIITTTPQSDGAPSLVYRPLNADGSNRNINYNGNDFTGIAFQCDENGNFYITGGFGIFGRAISSAPKVTGTKPTDPIVQQLLAAAVAYGFVEDGTTDATTSTSSDGTVTSGTTSS